MQTLLIVLLSSFVAAGHFLIMAPKARPRVTKRGGGGAPTEKAPGLTKDAKAKGSDANHTVSASKLKQVLTEEYPGQVGRLSTNFLHFLRTVYWQHRQTLSRGIAKISTLGPSPTHKCVGCGCSVFIIFIKVQIQEPD